MNPPEDIVRKARFVFDELTIRRIVGAETLTQHAIDIAAFVLDQSHNGQRITPGSAHQNGSEGVTP